MGVAPSSSPVPRAIIQPDLPLADSARLALAIGVAAMKYHEDAAIAGGIEPLHQMRVATRRLRATVGLFAGVIHGARARIYNRDLPWLGQAAGEVRECDMIEALVRDCSTEIDPALVAALAPLTEVISATRNTEHARFVNDLRTRRYRHMCERLADPLLRNALPAIDVGCNAPAMIEPIARGVRKAGKRIGRNAAPALFHRLRVKIKRLRYALEMLIEMGGKRSRKALIRLEELQELLGIHQDAVSAMAWLRKYAGEAMGVAPETLMAVGATVQVLTQRRQKLAARACREWRRVRHSGVIEDALEEISDAAGVRLEAARQARAAADDEARAHRLAEAVAAYSVESVQMTPIPTASEDSSQEAAMAASAEIDAPDPATSGTVAMDRLALKAEAEDPTATGSTGASAIGDGAAEVPDRRATDAITVARSSDVPAADASSVAVAPSEESTRTADGLSNQPPPGPVGPVADTAATSDPAETPPATLHHNTESR